MSPVETSQLVARIRQHSGALLEWSLMFTLLAVYLLTASRWLVGADNGEFVLLSIQPGRAHPPGYPLFVGYLKMASPVFSWATTAPHASALATSWLGWGACVALWRALRAWGVMRPASLIGALFFGMSQQVWLLHTHAEVFALNHLLCAMIIWFCAPNARVRGAWRVALLGLLAGLALANHHTAALLAPIGLYGVWLGVKESSSRWRALFIGALALAPGLSTYAMLLTAPECSDCLMWGDVESLDDVLGMFLRRDYGTFKLSGHDPSMQGWAQLISFAEHILGDLMYIGAPLAALGFWHTRDQQTLAQRVCLGTTFLLCGPLFFAAFDLPPEGVGLEVIRRFYGLPELLLVLWVAFGVDWVSEQMSHRRPLLIAVCVVLFGAMWMTGTQRIASHNNGVIESYARNLLEVLPDGALIIGGSDAGFLGLKYALATSNPPRQIEHIHPRLLRFDWYRARVARTLGVEPEALVELEPEQLIDLCLTERERVYWFEAPRSLRDSGRSVPVGATLMFTRAAPPDCDETYRRQDDAFSRMELVPATRDASLDAWSLALWDEYVRGWLTVAQRCEDDPATANRARARAVELLGASSDDLDAPESAQGDGP